MVGSGPPAYSTHLGSRGGQMTIQSFVAEIAKELGRDPKDMLLDS
jgi:hypothetical protein